MVIHIDKTASVAHHRAWDVIAPSGVGLLAQDFTFQAHRFSRPPEQERESLPLIKERLRYEKDTACTDILDRTVHVHLLAGRTVEGLYGDRDDLADLQVVPPLDDALLLA